MRHELNLYLLFTSYVASMMMLLLLLDRAMQNTRGADSKTKAPGFIETGQRLYQKFGLSIFFDGISSKVARAAVNHAVTFFVYDLILSQYVAQN